MGELAQPKAVSESVVQFAETMVNEHATHLIF
ncbi:putative outer membrane protein [Algoriphagus sp. 4150]|nr:putative outer membrane protein [Algoriphagus sp. 4150]